MPGRQIFRSEIATGGKASSNSNSAMKLKIEIEGAMINDPTKKNTHTHNKQANDEDNGICEHRFIVANTSK
jgi:hypothetical protein